MNPRSLTVVPSLLKVMAVSPTQQSGSCRQFNANTCAITRIRQSQYPRPFPVEMVFANGSTLTVRYDQSRAIIRVPLIEQDLKSDKERTAWLNRRKVKEVIVIKKDLSDVQYDSTDYLKYIWNFFEMSSWLKFKTVKYV